MKKITAFILMSALILSLALSFSACSSEKNENGVPDGMKLASNTEVADYYLYVPTGWIVTIQTALTAAEVSESDKSSISVCAFTNTSITVTDTVINDYWKTYEESLIKTFDTEKDENGNDKTTYALTGDAETITLKHGEENISAEKYTYTATLAGNKLKYMQVVSYYDDYFYIITFTSTPDGFEKNLDSFDEILSVFEFKS